jgi:peptidoglycan/xylan/chitin deacetylase (PgdA/CDA1 family)
VAAIALLGVVGAGAPTASASLPDDASRSVTVASAPTGSPVLDPLPRRSRGQAWERIPTRKKVVALTFDAGGGAGGVRRILRTLKAEEIPATFFLTGRWARVFPDKVKRIADAGYVLGNHTDTHRKVTSMSDARLRAELRSTERAIRAAAGRGTGPWFRFPYGSHTPHDIQRVNDLGYAGVQWTVDSAGWMGTSGGMSVTSVVDRVIRALRPGAIVLMHVGEHPTDGSTLDADALPRLVAELRSRGYTFVTVAALP